MSEERRCPEHREMLDRGRCGACEQAEAWAEEQHRPERFEGLSWFLRGSHDHYLDKNMPPFRSPLKTEREISEATRLSRRRHYYKHPEVRYQTAFGQTGVRDWPGSDRKEGGR